MKSEFNKCIKCKNYTNKWNKCNTCNKWVCNNCFIGDGLCTECMIATKGNKMVDEYFTEKGMGATQ